MENSNRNDVYKFFKDMPLEMQLEIISKNKKKVKKPPDSKLVEKTAVEERK